MADNTIINLGSGGDTIATDELTTLNGGAVSGFKAQRVKVGHGTDATFTDTKGSTPLPVTLDGRRNVSYYGRVSSFRTPGRAGTAGQKIFAIHNATGSAVLVDVEKISVDHEETAAKAVTVLPPVIRLYRVTVLPTNGTAGVKSPRDTALTSSTSLTTFCDASADGTGSGTALTATLTTQILTEIWAPRLITAAGYEMFDRVEFMNDEDEKITLRPLEGLVVMLDYVLATQNPTTDMWLVNCKWTEYTAAA